MLIQDRIRLIIKANQESPTSFASRIGINRSSLSHVLSGRNKPSLDFLEKIIRTYPKVNAAWLVTGETRKETSEPIQKDEKQQVLKSYEDKKEEEEINQPSNDIDIEQIVVFYTDGSFKKYQAN